VKKLHYPGSVYTGVGVISFSKSNSYKVGHHQAVDSFGCNLIMGTRKWYMLFGQRKKRKTGQVNSDLSLEKYYFQMGREVDITWTLNSRATSIPLFVKCVLPTGRVDALRRPPVLWASAGSNEISILKIK